MFLLVLCSYDFKTGSIPSEWKLAHLVPIHKKDDKNNIEAYRPISLTCIVSKVFEKCVRDELLIQCQLCTLGVAKIFRFTCTLFWSIPTYSRTLLQSFSEK